MNPAVQKFWVIVVISIVVFKFPSNYLFCIAVRWTDGQSTTQSQDGEQTLKMHVYNEEFLKIKWHIGDNENLLIKFWVMYDINAIQYIEWLPSAGETYMVWKASHSNFLDDKW